MDLLTADEAAAYMKVKKRTVYNWCSLGKIRPIRLGGLKFDRAYLDGFIKKHQRGFTDGVHN